MEQFTYAGPFDEVDVTIRVRRGDTIGVPKHAAGRVSSEERDPETNALISSELGEGLLAQPETWTHKPVTRTRTKKPTEA